MSESGFGHISSPARPAAQSGAGRVGQIVKIINLPDGLKDNARAVRLEGQIKQINSNGTVRIETSEGDVEVQIKNAKPSQTGQRLEIEIPAGRPPRQAALRESPQITRELSTQAPRQTAQQQLPSSTPVPTEVARPAATDGRPVQSAAVSTSPQNTSATERSIINASARNLSPTTPAAPNTPQTPQTTQNTAQTTNPTAVQEALLQNNNNAGQTSAPPRPVLPDTTLRLLPVPAAQTQNLATQYLQTLPQPLQNFLVKTDFTAGLIALNAKNQLLNVVQQIQPHPQLQFQAPAVIPALPVVETASTPLITNLQNIAQDPVIKNFFTPAANVAPPNAPPVLTAPPLPVAVVGAPSIVKTPLLQTAISNTQIIPPDLAIPPQQAGLLKITTAEGLPQLQTLPQTPALPQQAASLTPLPLSFDPNNPAGTALRPVQQIDVSILSISPPQTVLKIPPITGQNAAALLPLPPPTNPVPSNPTLITTPNPAASLTARVVGFTPNALPLVNLQWPGQSQSQNFVLQFKSSNLQIGSQLQVIPRVPNIAPIIPNLTQPLTSPSNPLLQGFQWPVLEELYNGLLQISPQAAASLARALPNAAQPNQIAPAAMMFIAAVRSGDLAAWLGDKKMEILQRLERPSLLNRLSQDNAPSAQRGADTTSGSDWRAIPLPMFWENEIHKITLYTRQEDQKQDQKGRKGGQTRFVFDLSLSRMGDVQLDGLLRDNRLDLVVRTQNAFSPPMQQTMRQAYSAALESTDLTGDVTFQGSTKNWVHVLQEQEKLGVHV